MVNLVIYLYVYFEFQLRSIQKLEVKLQNVIIFSPSQNLATHLFTIEVLGNSELLKTFVLIGLTVLVCNVTSANSASFELQR